LYDLPIRSAWVQSPNPRDAAGREVNAFGHASRSRGTSPESGDRLVRRHIRAALTLVARLTASLPVHLRTLNTIAVAALTIGCADDAAVAPAVVESPPSASLGFPPWTEMASAAGSGLEAVWGASPDEVFAVGLSGVIQRFDGTSWSVQATGTTSSLRDVWGSSEDDVWAVGGLGALLHYDGASWDLVARLENDAGTRYQLFG